MKRVALAVMVMGLIFGVAILAQTQTESVEQEIIKLEKAWDQSWVKPDFALMDRILADDYTWTGTTGEVSDKADEIAEMKSGEELFDSRTLDKIRVRVYGDVAVVNGLWTYKITEEGKTRTGQSQVTDTWVKIDGRWQCVAGHSSTVAEK